MQNVINNNKCFGSCMQPSGQPAFYWSDTAIRISNSKPGSLLESAGLWPPP